MRVKISNFLCQCNGLQENHRIMKDSKDENVEKWMDAHLFWAIIHFIIDDGKKFTKSLAVVGRLIFLNFPVTFAKVNFLLLNRPLGFALVAIFFNLHLFECIEERIWTSFIYYVLFKDQEFFAYIKVSNFFLNFYVKVGESLAWAFRSEGVCS